MKGKKKFIQFVKKTKILTWDLMFLFYGILISYEIVYQKLILEQRYSSFSWINALYCLIIAFIFSIIFSLFPRFSLGHVLYSERYPLNKKKWSLESFIFLLILIFLTFISGFHFSQISFVEFFSKSGWEGAKRILFSLLKPRFKILDEVLFSAIETLYMAFMATSFAIIPAFLLSFVASKNLTRSSLNLAFLYTVSRSLLNITRAVEPLIWAIIFSVWVGIGPFAGMLALSLHSVASLAKLYSEQIENMEEGPMEAIKSTGAHPLQIIFHGIVPQVFLSFLSFTIYRWDINVRMATVIGLVGGGGIGTILIQYQGNGRWNEVGLIIIVIAFIVSLMDTLSAKVRESIK